MQKLFSKPLNRLLLLVQNDNTIYKLLLGGLFVASPALHYLCYYDTYDPLWLRSINSILCLGALCLSFYPSIIYAKVSQYVAILSFVLINNCVLLSSNGFGHVYLFSSITIFIALTLFCKKRWEFITIYALNSIAVIVAYFGAAKLFISPAALPVLLFGFAFITYVAYLVVTAYKVKFNNAITNVVELNRTLIENDEILRENRRQLHALINSLNDVIVEFDENKICLNTWFSGGKKRAMDPTTAIGKRLEHILGHDNARKFDIALDHVIKYRKPSSLEFLSDLGTNRWFLAKLAPVYDQNNNYTWRISASIADISEQKKYAEALRENEALLLEAQAISKTGNWWHDHQTSETYLSQNLYKQLEIDSIPDDIGKFEYYMGLVHPDDRQNAYRYFTNVLEIAENSFEHRFITPKGNLKYIKVLKGHLLFDSDGKPKRISGVLQDITEAKLSEKIIKRSQAELLEAQTIAKIGNWKWRASGNKLSWSDEINRIFEVSAGVNTSLNFNRLLCKYIHPNDKRLLRALLLNGDRTPGTCYEFRIVTARGNTKHLSIIIGKLIRNEDRSVRKIIGTLQDVTEQKQAEFDLRRTEDKYKLVLETIKMPAISQDRNGTVIFCNKSMADLLGREQSSVLGLNWIENFIPEGSRHGLMAWFTSDAYEPQFTNKIICRNDEQRTISWQNSVSYDENGRVNEITSIGEDITDRQKATQDLILAKEDAERSSHFKSEFLSIMSHEIRTPMNAVIGTTNLLLSEDPKPEQLEYLNTLKFSGENLLAIINDILDYNKIEAGKLELNKTPFNIKHLIQKIKQSFYSRASEKGITVDLLLDDSIPNYLMGDQIRLSQVLNNLISNAVKFTHTGGVTIQLDNVAINNTEVTVKFSVADTGIGMAADYLDMIFDPFTQETQDAGNNYEGTGLGLAITKRLVELHQGSISVKSKPGEGSVFTFSIMFRIAQQEQNTAHQFLPQSTVDVTPNLQGMRILIVDDNKMNLLIASRFLKKWKAEPYEAISGELAIEMVKNNNYDVIIMDLQMPGMNGFETTNIIRLTHPDIPVIALTADAMPETHQKAKAAGMCDYLTKPFVPEVFYEKIAKHYCCAVHGS